MAFKRLNDLQLKEEYCVKPNTEKCPTLYCYDNEFQCRYWKQVWENTDGQVIRQGSRWFNGDN